MNARMTLIGMENQLNASNLSLNDTWDLLPTEEPIIDYDKDVLLYTIMERGGTFEPIYTDPEYFHWACNMWWKKWRHNFTKWAEVIDVKYAPLDNYNRHEERHMDITDEGTSDTATHLTEVMDDDTTRTHSSTEVMDDDTTNVLASTEVMDDDTTLNRTINGTLNEEIDGTSSNTNVVDAETTGNRTINEVADIDNTNAHTETQAITEDNQSTVAGTEVMDDDTTANSTTARTLTDNKSGSYNTEYTVAGFNSVSYEPKNNEANSHQDADTVNENITVAESGTDDRTTTRNETTNEDNTRNISITANDTGTEDRETDTTEKSAGTEDRTTTDNGTTHNERETTTSDVTAETGTDDRTTTLNTQQTGTDDRTTTLQGNEAGTDDRTTTADGTAAVRTTNDRDHDESAHMWGNIGVTTSQKMMQEELYVRKWNVYNNIADVFFNELCVMVY